MNRIDRLTAIILMLQNHRVVTADKISERFEISIRTVYRDIAALGEAGVPIVAEACVGYSLMRGYNLPPIMFTEAEAAALFISVELTERLGDNSLKQSLSDAMLKVRAVLPDGHKNHLLKLGSSMEVWSRPRNEPQKGHHYLMLVQGAVVRQQCLSIQYDTGNRGKLTERVVEGLGLVFYSYQWHLIAWCRLREEVRDFRLDRIKDCKLLVESVSSRREFSLEDYLQCNIEEKAMVPVLIECEQWTLERVLHDMPCKIKSKRQFTDDRFLIEAKAYSLEWLARWLTGIGSSVVVRSPKTLSDLVVAEAQRIIRLYQ